MKIGSCSPQRIRVGNSRTVSRFSTRSLKNGRAPTSSPGGVVAATRLAWASGGVAVVGHLPVGELASFVRGGDERSTSGPDLVSSARPIGFPMPRENSSLEGSPFSGHDHVLLKNEASGQRWALLGGVEAERSAPVVPDHGHVRVQVVDESQQRLRLLVRSVAEVGPGGRQAEAGKVERDASVAIAEGGDDVSDKTNDQTGLPCSISRVGPLPSST